MKNNARTLSTFVFGLLLLTAITENVFGQSGDGQIVFSSIRDGNYEIYKMNADGSGQTRLTNNSAADYEPQWSPDGTKIVFNSGMDGNQEIYVMNADGSNQTRITNNTFFDTEASWSPDGTKIVFQSNRSGRDIYVINQDGTNETRLTTDPKLDIYPKWSPDGTQITFISTRDGGFEIYVMAADGSNQRRVTYTGGFLPDWSPDGSRLLYINWNPTTFTTQIFVMNADGTNQQQLTNTLSDNDTPAWSPDGSKIAFSSTRDGNLEVYTMNADGTNQERLTFAAGYDYFPDWISNPYSYTAATAIGQNVSVAPISNLSLTFSNVISEGNTTATVLTPDQLQPLPSNFTLLGSSLMFDITTTAVFSGNITVTFDVPNVSSAAACSLLRILHYTNNDWDLSGNAVSVYNASNQTCRLSQTVSSLSPFVVVQSNPPASVEQCKNGGWMRFDTPRSFKNQGECIQFVNKGK